MLKWIKSRKSFFLGGLRDLVIVFVTLLIIQHFFGIFEPQEGDGAPAQRLSYELKTEDYNCIEYNHNGIWWVVCLPDTFFGRPYIIRNNNGQPTIIEVER